MKTFDEAFEIVNRNQETLDADLDAFGHEGLRNDAFVTLVIKLCDHWMSRLQTVEEDKCAAFTCTSFRLSLTSV
jgi:hypothetical protein